MNLKGNGKKRSSSNEFVRRDSGKSSKSSVRIAGFQDEI
jgi:hypothetical protein